MLFLFVSWRQRSTSGAQSIKFWINVADLLYQSYGGERPRERASLQIDAIFSPHLFRDLEAVFVRHPVTNLNRSFTGISNFVVVSLTSG